MALTSHSPRGQQLTTRKRRSLCGVPACWVVVVLVTAVTAATEWGGSIPRAVDAFHLSPVPSRGRRTTATRIVGSPHRSTLAGAGAGITAQQDGTTPRGSSRRSISTTTTPTTPTTTVLASSFMEDMMKFFEQFGNTSNNSTEGSASSADNVEDDDDDDDDDDPLPAGTARIVSIPVRSIKPGGLRLFLMFYLLGQQNTPDKNTWKASQPSTEDYVLEFWFRDNSAVLTLTLESNRVTLDRTGSSPSVAYLMQETAVVQGILDELQLMASDDLVEAKDRLLLLEQPDSIQQARDSLAFS